MEIDDPARAFWETHAAGYDRGNAVLSGPMRQVAALVAESVKGAESVLEVGAGTGLVTVALARTARQVIATDYAVAMVERLEARICALNVENVRCARADLFALPFEAASFDAVVAANVLHLVPDLSGALGALRRALKPGGRLIVPTYCHGETRLSRLISRLLARRGFPASRRFTFRTLQSQLEESGLDVSRFAPIRGVIPVGYAEGTFPPAP